ncbi:FliH/SctL family protein [Goekera deserti]|uniref:FliH/SctL family protein n=1 Tax=Goekera deserti TaxID=2497753 RepID=UPI001F2CF13F|nr:FliH/SctL family protein [Goekera deserti]
MRESALLRGESAASARPYRAAGEDDIGSVAGGGRIRGARSAPAPAPAAAPARPSAAPAPRPVPSTEQRPDLRARATRPAGTTADAAAAGDPRAAMAGQRPAVRLDEVYADELTRLHEQARAAGHAAGYAQGLAAGAAQSAAAVAEAERAAADRLAVVHQHWERQWSSAAAALATAAARFDSAVAPVADEVSDLITDNVFDLVAELLGRELAAATTPGRDAVRRALGMCPADAPVVVRLHPEDLASLTAGDRTELRAGVTIVPDAGVERGGALAESGPRRIDAQLGPALERVRQVLLP